MTSLLHQAHLDACRRYRKKYPKRCLQANQKWRKANPEKVQGFNRIHKAKRNYSIARKEYETLEPRLINGPCEICGTNNPGKRRTRFCIDHNHQTEAFRGILCNQCNRAIGLMEDDPVRLAAAAAYLRKEQSLADR